MDELMDGWTDGRVDGLVHAQIGLEWIRQVGRQAGMQVDQIWNHQICGNCM